VRASPRWPWVAAAVAVALAAFAAVTDQLPGSGGDPLWVTALALVLIAASIALGVLVAVRRPGNPIGALLLANAVILSLAFATEVYARYALLAHPGALPAARWFALWDDSAWPLLFAPFTAIAFVFPDGHLPSPRWRPVAGCAIASFALLLVTNFLRPLGPPYDAVTDNPLPELPGIVDALSMLAMLGVLVSLVAAFRAVQVRFRRATGVERMQLKWLAYSACVIPLSMLVGLATRNDDARTATVLVMAAALPGGVAIAILRYRLYEIDRLINRTLVYGVLTLLLAAGYAAITLGLGVAAGSGSAWTTAVATLAVAATFLPLRTRVQHAVDRRFARARYDALRRVEAFLSDLRGGRAAPEEIEGVLAQTLADPSLELHYWLTAGELYADARGNPAAEPAAHDGRVRTPVSRGGARMGVVVHDRTLDERPLLLTSVIEAAGLAIEIARLRVELRRQLEEVEASRARIVAAGYDERRRIERDLHDGAQQRMVSIGLALRHLQHELPPDAESASAALDDTVTEITHAIGELRELARGVRPSQLDDGIGPALRELAERSAVPVEVRASGERFAPSLERPPTSSSARA
jgi:signal transduction histidine kinase